MSTLKTPPNLRELRARKRRAWSDLAAGETVEIQIDLGKAYALETRRTTKRHSSMMRNATLEVRSVSFGEISGLVTMLGQCGERFPARNARISTLGLVILQGPEWYCEEHKLPARPPFVA